MNFDVSPKALCEMCKIIHGSKSFTSTVNVMIHAWLGIASDKES